MNGRASSAVKAGQVEQSAEWSVLDERVVVQDFFRFFVAEAFVRVSRS